MLETKFERQIQAIIQQPDNKTTRRLYWSCQKLGPGTEAEMLTALAFIARNFSSQTAQGAYEVIRFGSGALPEEMISSAVYLQAGHTPEQVSRMAHDGRLPIFDPSSFVDKWSTLALCRIQAHGQAALSYTQRFGHFDPEAAYGSAMAYALEHNCSLSDALWDLTEDLAVAPGRWRGIKILAGRDPELFHALDACFGQCPAVAARITFDADRDAVAVEMNPLWVQLRETQLQSSPGMELR